MTATRRTRDNYALDRALELARALNKPLVVVEGLRCGHRWASPRFHRFVLEGMADNARAFEGTGILYHPFVERAPDEGRGLLHALSEKASAVVADESPAFFFPHMLAAARKVVATRFEAVDSNGLLPLRASDRERSRAFDFRRLVQKILLDHLGQPARSHPLRRCSVRPLAQLPARIRQQWPAALLEENSIDLASLPLDHQVVPVALKGGSRAGRRAMRRFVKGALESYTDMRSHPDVTGTSGLSPYLHFGHVGAREVFDAVMTMEDWSPRRLGLGCSGSRTGWWGVSASAEAFLDQLVTWRELGFHFCFHRPDHQDYRSLPAWARKSLAEHAADPRPFLYTLEEFETGSTHDPLWNAAQRQLRETGLMHNALRMLWGKKILHWSRSPQEAWQILFALNDRWALDGRDPNSSSGIGWTLGRFDRAWGPERPVFGKIRFMTSDSARRKLRLKSWLANWSEESDLLRGKREELCPRAPSDRV
ncbi:MAG: FAD-binding domain-containing protein [Planctomycetota bacterium]|nr:FAD-binding domain-containing protein [Planctomycetota bacterium]